MFNKKLKLQIQQMQEAIDLYRRDVEYEREINQKYCVHDIAKANEELLHLKKEVEMLQTQLSALNEKREKTNEDIEKKEKTLNTNINKTKRLKSLCEAMQFSFDSDDYEYAKHLISEVNDIAPETIYEYKCLTYKDLRKEFRENEKNISAILDKYKAGYTTKTNRALYQLMVLAMQSELQNILIVMKYDKLDIAKQRVEDMCVRFYNIAAEGNQSIAPTLKRFIGELQFLYMRAVEIEYEYYIKKQQEKEEQAAIREQMRQEAEERRELEKQRKQVEKEESKFVTEIENVKQQMNETDDNEKLALLKAKIKELEEKLEKVEERKEDIINRQNGKAGNVYVISNLGSFGDDVFKVGMTRRLEPMDRVKELGDASVPFAFDVHAMIFSEDAVSLENKLHEELAEYRLNKVNIRKEFFKLSLDKIEEIVLENDPAASFDRTMVAEQYRQSLSM